MALTNPGPNAQQESTRPDYLALGAALAVTIGLSVLLLVDQLRHRITHNTRPRTGEEQGYEKGYLDAVTQHPPRMGSIQSLN